MRYPILLALAAVLTFLSGCEKDQEGDARINIINGSPDAPPLSLVLNGTAVIKQVAGATAGSYVQMKPGNYSTQVQATGSTSSYISNSITLGASKSYTVVVADSVKRIKSSLVEDDLSAPVPNTAHVRFFHLAPNAPGIDIRVGDKVVFSNRYFNDQATDGKLAAFTPVSVGANGLTQSLTVLLAGTNTIVFQVPAVPVEPGKIYTVVARTAPGSGGAASISAAIFQNK